MKTGLSVLLITVALLLAVVLAEAQQTAKIPQIGYLNTQMRQSLSDSSERQGHLSEAFRQGLRELGYAEGQNIIINERIGEESQLRDLATDLVRLKMDVIVAEPAAIAAAISATATIPIVAVFRGDPFVSGNVASLDRPGGNVTGIAGLTSALGGKWLELIKETIPSASRVLVFWNRGAERRFPIWKSVDSAAHSIGVELKWEAGSGNAPANYFYHRLRSVELSHSDAFIVLPTAIRQDLEDIALFGLRNRIPGIFWRTDLDLDQVGGFMSYGANRAEQSRRAAYFVDKILKGAKPAELPVELPKKFELVINLKTAKEIGVAVPPRVLAWADKVIK